MIKSAAWITSSKKWDSAAYSYEKSFCTAHNKKVKSATLEISAMGAYLPFLNGKRVGEYLLMPGWTSYRTRVQYQSYDVTELLAEKENHIRIGLGNGWAKSRVGFTPDSRNYYSASTALIASLTITYCDGSREEINTDESWQVYNTEVSFSEIYDGETVDKTYERSLLTNAVFADIRSRLVKQIGEYICEQERLAPISIITTPRGERVIDFGQNMTGYVELKIKAPRGSRILIDHAEVLDKDGNFYTDNYRSAKSRLIYVTSGEDDVFKPSYTFFGFRYIRLTEYPFSEVDLNGFSAIVLHSDIKRTGRYSTGNKLINQLYHNIIWGQKSNYLDVPTDCPQRDERLGWTGDTQVFCRTAAINYDVRKFFKKWLGDVAIEQKQLGGAVGSIIPTPQDIGRISAAWGDCATIVPWEIYLAYGSKTLLKKHFPIMKRWVDYLHSIGPAEYLWLGGNHYGDWLGMDAGEDSYTGATSKDLIASAFFAYSTELLIKAGEIIGKDMSEYKTLHSEIVRAFREYFMENGMPKERVASTHETENAAFCRCNTQTALVLILKFGLATEEEMPRLAALLSKLIKENDGLMSTGFVGTPYLLHVLSENGYVKQAYDLLLEERVPSWLYSVQHGATTMWEHWNGIKEDGSFWSHNMNSFNHYAYGAVFDWMFGVSAGIKPTERGAGYKEITLMPKPDKRLGYSDAEIASVRGKIRSHWHYDGESVVYEFEIPRGTVAYLELPSGRREVLYGGKYRFEE